jgi:pimeloyl-ACP methyl ester carboxylesterase
MKDYVGALLTGSDPKVRDSIMKELESADREMIISIVRELFKYDPLPALAGYNGPLLSVVTPGNDNQYSLHKLLPDLLHVVIPGTGHWIHMDKPEEFNALLDTFLNIVDAELAGTARRTGT